MQGLGSFKVGTMTSQALLDIYNSFPFVIERGEGVYLYDTSGKRYIDFYGGHAVTIVGHSPAKVVAAIAQQAKKFMFYSNLVQCPIREQGAAELLRFGKFDDHKVFFCNSGGEANENALKVAIKLTGRAKIISFHGGFHGRTMLALGATDHPDWHETYRGWVGPIERITPNLEAELTKIDSETAAVILEPIQSIGGVTEFVQPYLEKLRARCDAVGAMLIFDEVQTGMGRTGVPFVSTAFKKAAPDMTTLAKGIAGGFAMGAVIMRSEIGAGLVKGDIAATFGGGPMAVAAMMAVIETIEEEKLLEQAAATEEFVRAQFADLPLKEIRGRGCLLGLVGAKPAREIQNALFERGMITGPNSNPNLVHLLPPLTIASDHLTQLKEALVELL